MWFRIRTTRPLVGQFSRTVQCIGHDEWFYSVVVILVGSCPGGELVLGIVGPLGNGWALFLSGGELSLVGSCPRDRGPGGQWLGLIFIRSGIVLGG